MMNAITAALCIIACGCVRDDMPYDEAADAQATLILNIGLNGTTLHQPREARRISSGDYNGAEDGELMHTLRVIIADSGGTVEHNLLFGSLDDAAAYTTDRVIVKANDRKTIYIVANEEAVIPEGTYSSATEMLDALRPGSKVSEEDMAATVILADRHKPLWDDPDKRLLPITAIEHVDIGGDEEYVKTLWIHRAAVKYTFLVSNLTDRAVRLDSVMILGATDREFLFPAADGYTAVDITSNNWRPLSYRTPPATGFRPVAHAAPLSIGPGESEVRLPRSFYFTEGMVLRGIFNQGDETVEDVYKVAAVVNGVRTPWRNLEWFYPESPTELRDMTDLPRNTHVVVQLNILPHGVSFSACVQPYAACSLDPFFGLDRDIDGNIIRRREDDGTFWADNPRYGINGDTRKTIWKDAYGDEIRKKFSDGSFLCTERMYRDWIHDDSESDHEYTFEKDLASGNMVIIRQKSSSDKITDLFDTAHDHDMSDRPLFIKLSESFRDMKGWDIPVGTHMMVTYAPDGTPSYSRVDMDGDTILQANGYQFRDSQEMAPWRDTYLVKHPVGNDGGEGGGFVLQVKRRDGTVIVPDYRGDSMSSSLRKR